MTEESTKGALAHHDVGAPFRLSGDQPRTLVDVAYKQLLEDILVGRLAPGERLPVEQLEEGLQMSRVPVREALRQLAAQGLVELVPHQGARVVGVSREDMREIYQLRVILETHAIREAARRFNESDYQLASERLEEYKGSPAVESRKAHMDFHKALYAAARSRWLLRLLQPLSENSERYRLIALRGRQPEQRFEEHQRLLELCRAHNPEGAAKLLEGHLELTRQLVLSELDRVAPGNRWQR